MSYMKRWLEDCSEELGYDGLITDEVLALASRESCPHAWEKAMTRAPRRTPRETPVYTLALAFGPPIATVFGLDGLLDNLPRLDPDLYSIDLAVACEPYDTIGTAAVHESGAWTLTFADGTEYGGSGNRVSFMIV